MFSFQTKKVEEISETLTVNHSAKEKVSVKEEEKEALKDEEKDSVQEAKHNSLREDVHSVNDTDDKHQVTKTQDAHPVTTMKDVSPVKDTADEHTFSNFASKNFQGEVTHSHSIELLTQPLLVLSSEADQLVRTHLLKKVLNIFS